MVPVGAIPKVRFGAGAVLPSTPHIGHQQLPIVGIGTVAIVAGHWTAFDIKPVKKIR